LSPPSSVLMTFELKGAASCIRHENKFSSRFWIWLFPFNFVHKFSIWVKNVFLNNFFGNERSVPRLQLHIIPRSSSLYFNTKEIISLKYKIISLGNNFFFQQKEIHGILYWVIDGTACGRFYVVLGCGIQQRYFNW
jgi:hypothetical protein